MEPLGGLSLSARRRVTNQSCFGFCLNCLAVMNYR